MEHRDQRHENNGVHICNKCGWPFPKPHPSAKHRRAHKRVCGKIEGYKSVQSEACTQLTVSDDEGLAVDDHRKSSPRVLEESFHEKGIDGIGNKAKEYEDEVFSDAVAEFSVSLNGVGTNKPTGDALNSITTSEMVNDEMNFSGSLKDREIVDIVPSSSCSTENRIAENSDDAENTINQTGSELESNSNHEMNLKTDFRAGEPVIMLGAHMNTATGDLYPIESEVVVAASQERYINCVENAPQCSMTSSDGSFDAMKNKSFTSGKIDIDESEPGPKMEEGFEMPPEPTRPDGMEVLKADNDMFIDSIMPPSDVPEVKSFGLTQLSSDARKETQSCSPDNLLGTSNTSEGIENVDLLSESSDLNVVDHPDAFVTDFKDHKEVKVISFVLQDTCQGAIGSDDILKDPSTESSTTFQAKPFNQASDIASYDRQAVESKEKQGNGGNNVPIDREVHCSKNSGCNVEEIPAQEKDATQIKGILSENETQDTSQTLSDTALFGIDGTDSGCISSEVEPMAPSENSSPDNFIKHVTEDLSDENYAHITDDRAGISGGCLAKDDEVGTRGKKLEDLVLVHLPADAGERADNDACEKNKFDNQDIAGVECKRGPTGENIPVDVNSRPESPTNNRENKCHAVAEDLADGSPRKLSRTESADLKSFDISLGLDSKQSVKEDSSDSNVDVECINEVNADDMSCQIKDFDSVRKASDEHVEKEATLGSISNESAMERSATSQDNSARQFVGDAARIGSETGHDEDQKNVKPQLMSSLIDASVDSSSQTDSLEGNWGSVSVISTQSDLLAVVDAEVIPHATTGAEETNPKKVEPVTKRQHSDKSDLFEPPSFMTLVEPSGGGFQNSAALEIQTSQNPPQPNSPSLQAGWFPSYTHVTSDSPGRKKNEAIIAKVTNWSTGKPHTALKNLLDDAALENKQKSPNLKENLASVIRKDETMGNDGSVGVTVDSVVRPKSPTSMSENEENAKEWNSPARYPSDIKREKRRGRPYWAQFVCCSSVH